MEIVELIKVSTIFLKKQQQWVVQGMEISILLRFERASRLSLKSKHARSSYDSFHLNSGRSREISTGQVIYFDNYFYMSSLCKFERPVYFYFCEK